MWISSVFRNSMKTKGLLKTRNVSVTCKMVTLAVIQTKSVCRCRLSPFVGTPIFLSRFSFLSSTLCGWS